MGTVPSGQPPLLETWGGDNLGRGRHSPLLGASREPHRASDTTADGHVADVGGGGFGNLARKLSAELWLRPRISRSTIRGTQAENLSTPLGGGNAAWEWRGCPAAFRPCLPPSPAPRRPRKRLRKQSAAGLGRGPQCQQCPPPESSGRGIGQGQSWAFISVPVYPEGMGWRWFLGGGWQCPVVGGVAGGEGCFGGS